MRLEDQELNSARQELSVHDILREYREPELSPADEAEEDEPVRIYQPRRERREAQEQREARERRQERLARDFPPEELDEDGGEEPAEEAPGPWQRAGRALTGLLGRLGRKPSEPEAQPELLSFDELLYGKKEEPVHILEEEEPSPAPEPEEALSVDAILADYWTEPTESGPAAAPVRSRRQLREEREQAEKARAQAEKARAREERAARWEERRAAMKRRAESPAPEAPEPIPEPVPQPEPAPRPEPEKETIRPADMSVDEILAEYWGRPAAPAREPAPPSRRGTAPMREEREPVPPTGAAPSAAANKRPAPRPRAERRSPDPAPKAPAPAAAPAVSPAPRAEPRPDKPPRKTNNEEVDFSAMSVDDILAEYNDILSAMPAAVSSAASAPVSAAPKGSGSVSRMEQEARSFIDQMKSEDFAGLREEAAYERPRKDPAPADEGLRRLLDQLPGQPKPEQETEQPARRYRLPSDEVDPRFNLSGERKSAMVFDGKELDLSADESYVPPKAAEGPDYLRSGGDEEEQAQAKPRLIDRLKQVRSPRRQAPKPAPQTAPAEEAEQTDPQELSEGYDDLRQPAYAPDRDYEPEEDEEREPNPFPSFRQYLSNLVSGSLVRLMGARRPGVGTAGTMEDEREDLGPELSPAAASKYYGSFVTSLRIRVRIALVLLAVMTWISLGLPVSGALRTAPVAAGMVLAIQLVILLLGLDVVTGSAVNLARGRFGADSLAVLSCLLTSFDALTVCLGVLGRPHMPLCLASSLSFFGVMLSSLISARALRKSLRVPAIGRRCYGVTVEPAVKGSGMTLLKSLRPPKGFVRRSEEAAPDEEAFYRVSPLLALLSLPLMLIVAAVKHAFPDFLYILSALLCPAVPLSALLCFALPYLFGSLRIFQSGAAIAGWSGVTDIGRSDNLIVTDRDLFPEGSVEIDTVRIFAEMEPETIISYAGTMICASESDLAPCFAGLMERNGCSMRRVEGFEYLTGGGMKGVIDGSVVLCGGVDLMRLMNVRVPFRLVGKTTVLLAVDGILCGIFNMKYEGQPQVRGALVGLIRSNRHPVFAIRDFLVTPEMLSNCFDVATDGYDFPPYVDRYPISEAKPAEDSKIAAVVCREGLGPLVHMADTGRSLYLTVRVNLILTVFAAVLGVLVVFFRLMWVGTIGSGFLLLFLLLWAIPVLGISIFLRF